MQAFKDELLKRFVNTMRDNVIPGSGTLTGVELVDIALSCAQEMLVLPGVPAKLYTPRQVRACLKTESYVCLPCGQQFLSPRQLYTRIRRPLVITMHDARCGLCHKVRAVTHVRHFNYLRERKE